MNRRCGVASLVLCAAACTRVPREPATTPGAAAVSSSAGSRWVERDAARAAAAGAGAPVTVADGAGAPGDSLGGRVEVPSGSCALFLAGGGPTVEDLDLFVYAEDGTVLGSDEGVNRSAAALVCPEHPVHLYAFGRVAAGHGLLTVSVQLVHPDVAERVARAAGAAGRLTERSVDDAAWPGLDEALLAHRRELGAAWRETRRIAVPLDPRVPTRLSVNIEAGGCVDAFVLPGEEVAFVELVALDGAGRILGRSPEGGNPSLSMCASTRSAATLELRPHAGRGLGAVVISATSDRRAIDGQREVVSVDPGATVPLAAARAALGERLGAAGYAGARPSGTGTAAVGRRTSLDLELPPGCARIDVIGGTPLRGVDAWLWSSGGTLMGHDDGAAGAVLFACGGKELARLDVEAASRSGPFAIELRPMPGAAPALVQEPLAASRLLGRLAATGRLSGPRDLVAPTKVGLSPDALSTGEALVPVGRCLTVALALGPGAEGAELRLVDVDSREEVAFARGSHSAIAEVCAIARPSSLKLRFEARVVAGAGTGLIGTRLSAPAPAR